MYQGFEQALLGNGDLILGLSRFKLMTQLPQKMFLTSKVVKRGPKNNNHNDPANPKNVSHFKSGQELVGQKIIIILLLLQ